MNYVNVRLGTLKDEEAVQRWVAEHSGKLTEAVPQGAGDRAVRGSISSPVSCRVRTGPVGSTPSELWNIASATVNAVVQHDYAHGDRRRSRSWKTT